MVIALMLVALVGIILCVYGMYVERQIMHTDSYKPLCDLSDTVSCSKAFLGPWGKTFGISNIYLGLMFYICMLICAWLQWIDLAFYGASIALLATVYFAYVLYAKVRAYCLICIGTYIINIVLWVITYYAR